MLMHRVLNPAGGRFNAQIKLLEESSFGVRVIETLNVRYEGAEHLRERIVRALECTGVNLVRWENMEFRLINGELHEQCMWHLAR